ESERCQFPPKNVAPGSDWKNKIRVSNVFISHFHITTCYCTEPYTCAPRDALLYVLLLILPPCTG
ncbi:MAG: hypothetical protein NXI25_17500, partial [bacterium]|nr:hypothetical protein [bacterium]